MKLLQILARELEVWPKGVLKIVQNYSYNLEGYGEDCGEVNPATDCWNGRDYTGFHKESKFLASDRRTAIVTRADWEAERAKLKAHKADADGWIQHHGGKCPVEAGTLVDVQYRSGRVNEHVKASVYPCLCGSMPKYNAAEWDHDGSSNDIMAYRIHKPAEQLAQVSEETIKTVEPCKFDAIAIRDRIRELDTRRAEVESTYQRQISEITQERESLVQKLAGEGLALVEVVVRPDKSLDDWRNWKAGDVVEVELENDAGLAIGSQHVVRSVEEEEYDGAMPVSVWIVSDYTWPEAQDESGRCVFKFVSRPAS